MESDAVIVAALEGNRAALVEALEASGDPSATGVRYTPLTAAVSEGHHSIARTLLEAGARPDQPSPFGLTPLGLAVQLGDIRMARLLLQHGADPEIRQYGEPVLSVAQELGNDEFIEVLLAYGAKPVGEANWAPDSEGPTVIMTSVSVASPSESDSDILD